MIEPVDTPLELESTGAGANVLLVEDNRAVGEVVSAMLEAYGQSVAWVTDAESAVRLLERGQSCFALVILPGMNGVALARLIRERWPAIRIVLASGYSDILAGTEPAEFEVVHKPYSPERLEEILDGIDGRLEP